MHRKSSKPEADGKAYVLRLSGDYYISLFEKDTDKLLELYNFGRKLAIDHADNIIKWYNSNLSVDKKEI